MDNIKIFLNNIIHTQIISSDIVVIVSILLYKGVSYIWEKGEEKDRLNLFTDKKSRTYLKLIKSLIRYLFIAVTILILLQINGIDVSSALAGVGILGVIFGLAIQDWLKDVIRGSSIISDRYFSVGDIVKYGDMEGKVLVIGLKTTKIQDLKTGYIKSIANRKIEEIDVVSNLVYINIPMPYELSIEKSEKAICDIVNNVKTNNDCKYMGVNELADSYIKYLIEIRCNQQHKLQVKRDALRSILVEMANNKIEVPYTQIDIHEK